jgi:uncharacterized membrane protein
MLKVIIEIVFPELIYVLEIMGMLVICYGSARAFLLYIKSQFVSIEANIKLTLGKALELGLEFKIGAEILKTVLIRDMSEIWILGSVIILRTILSAILHFELKAEAKSMEKK